MIHVDGAQRLLRKKRCHDATSFPTVMSTPDNLIRNKKTIVLFERNCHATEKSEAIACARRCRSHRLAGWWTQKEYSEKMEG
jgi:hypothetical protein